jgi:acyl-coenzyme A synthetase/AMP-(fatty) acid ligase
MLVLSPLTPPPVTQHLLASARCLFLLHASQEDDQIKHILQGNPDIQSILVPDLSTWLDAPPIASSPASKPWIEGRDDPWLIFHTSGTTGLPKLVTYTNRMMTSFRIARSLPGPMASTQLGWHINRRCYAVVPMSHFSGLCAALQSPVFLNETVIVGSRTKPPIPTVVAETLKYSKADGLVALPAQLRSMVRQPEYFDVLKDLDFVQWVGASLDAETGTALSRHVKLCPAMGTTECGPYFLNTAEDPQDWACYLFQAGQGIQFVERAENLYELIFKKSADAVWQQIFLVFPSLEVYETKDLFRKHPSKEGLWSYVGRADDVIVLSNSANINAASVEEKLLAHSYIQAALVGGSGRDHSFAIIELTPAGSEMFGTEGLGATLDAVSSVIDEANQGLSIYTKLCRDFIIFTGSTRGLSKSPKGTIMRGPSMRTFEKEVDALFSAANI